MTCGHEEQDGLLFLCREMWNECGGAEITGYYDDGKLVSVLLTASELYLDADDCDRMARWFTDAGKRIRGEA
jgi:hypothetical protein